MWLPQWKRAVDVFHKNLGLLGGAGPIVETCMSEFDFKMDVNIGGSFLSVEHVA